MKTKQFKFFNGWFNLYIEVEGNEFRVKRASDAWWIRFPITDELREFLRSI
jgi:hypothetical protein